MIEEHFKTICEEKNFLFNTVSSDQILLNLLGDVSDLNPTKRKELFAKNRKKGKNIYQSEFLFNLHRAQELIYWTDKNAIVLVKDKNHLYVSLEEEINYIKSFLYGMKYFIVLAVPLIEEDKKVPGISNEILVACLDNIRNRKPGHLLIYEGINTYEVLKQF